MQNSIKKTLLGIFKNRKIKFLSKNNFAFLFITISLVVVLSPMYLSLQWMCLTLAMFSTMANDSIQTLGTFLTSNAKVPWWKMWLYIGFLFVFIVILGWITSNRMIDFDRLTNIPYKNNFTIMHLMAPLILMFLTYNKIPASTTFLILSVFSSQTMITKMLIKTLFGYLIAFILSFIFWSTISRFFSKFINISTSKTKNLKWKVLQWLSTGFLWMSWLTQNTVNIVVYIPRQLNLYSLCLFLFVGLIMIAFTFYNRGGPIQEIVSEKKDMENIKSATLINFLFGSVIILLSLINKIPMATTWVFIGILAGRELSMAKYDNDAEISIIERYRNAKAIILKDLISSILGISLSLFFSMLNTTYFIKNHIGY